MKEEKGKIQPGGVADSEFGMLSDNNTIREAVALMVENNGGAPIRAVDLARIGLPASTEKRPTFMLPGEKFVPVFRGVILLNAVSRRYFKGEYDPNRGTPPDCFSGDGGFTGVGDNGEGAGQHDCATCPCNDDNRCREGRLLVIAVDGFAFPLTLDAPPTSITNVRKYATALAMEGCRISDVVTEFGLELVKGKRGNAYATTLRKDAVFPVVRRTQNREFGQGFAKALGFPSATSLPMAPQIAEKSSDNVDPAPARARRKSK